MLIRTNYILVTNAPAPVADFAADFTSGIAPLTVSFTNLSIGAVSYNWTFGDGNVSTNETPSNIYTNAGSYTVSLTAIGAGGSHTLTRTNYIAVTAPPPLILAGALIGSDFVLSFPSIAGKTYDVQYKDSLNDSLWQLLQSVTGDGNVLNITNSLAAGGERYFRLNVP